jgi:hypothetical protein
MILQMINWHIGRFFRDLEQQVTRSISGRAAALRAAAGASPFVAIWRRIAPTAATRLRSDGESNAENKQRP